MAKELKPAEMAAIFIDWLDEQLDPARAQEALDIVAERRPDLFRGQSPQAERPYPAPDATPYLLEMDQLGLSSRGLRTLEEIVYNAVSGEIGRNLSPDSSLRVEAQIAGALSRRTGDFSATDYFEVVSLLQPVVTQPEYSEALQVRWHLRSAPPGTVRPLVRSGVPRDIQLIAPLSGTILAIALRGNLQYTFSQGRHLHTLTAQFRSTVAITWQKNPLMDGPFLVRFSLAGRLVEGTAYVASVQATAFSNGTNMFEAYLHIMDLDAR